MWNSFILFPEKCIRASHLNSQFQCLTEIGLVLSPQFPYIEIYISRWMWVYLNIYKFTIYFWLFFCTENWFFLLLYKNILDIRNVTVCTTDYLPVLIIIHIQEKKRRLENKVNLTRISIISFLSVTMYTNWNAYSFLAVKYDLFILLKICGYFYIVYCSIYVVVFYCFMCVVFV